MAKIQSTVGDMAGICNVFLHDDRRGGRIPLLSVSAALPPLVRLAGQGCGTKLQAELTLQPTGKKGRRPPEK